MTIIESPRQHFKLMNAIIYYLHIVYRLTCHAMPATGRIWTHKSYNCTARMGQQVQNKRTQRRNLVGGFTPLKNISQFG